MGCTVEDIVVWIVEALQVQTDITDFSLTFNFQLSSQDMLLLENAQFHSTDKTTCFPLSSYLEAALTEIYK